MLSNNVKSRRGFTGKKIGASSQIKDRTEKKHNHDISSVDIEVIKKVFIFIFFYKRYFKHLKHKQKHLSNIQPNISISKKASK